MPEFTPKGLKTAAMTRRFEVHGRFKVEADQAVLSRWRDAVTPCRYTAHHREPNERLG